MTKEVLNVDYPNAVMFTGIPSRVEEPVEPGPSLELVYAIVMATFEAKRDAMKRNLADQHKLDITVFDSGQIANIAANRKDPKDTGFHPGSLPSVFAHDFGDNQLIAERWRALEPLSLRACRINQAIIDVLGLDRIHPVQAVSMQKDPSHLWHRPQFRERLAAVWGSRDTKMSVMNERNQKLGDLLWHQLVPMRYNKSDTQRRDGLLSYGVMEIAAIIHAALSQVTLFQYDNRRESGFLEIARQLLQIQGWEAERTQDRLVKLADVTGMYLNGNTTDAYRVNPDEISRTVNKRKRLTLNPAPTQEELRQIFLNGAGKFDLEKSTYIERYIVEFLNRSKRLFDVTIENRRRVGGIYKTSMGGLPNVVSADAEFLLELLFAKVIDPLAKAYLEQGLGCDYTDNGNANTAPPSGDTGL